MNNQTTKQGFSLIEVMILFTVLAVAMAATLPVITKKSKAVPQNASTGVYRCIAIGNGKFREERYNAKKLIKSTDVTECTFKPSKASVYKIDIYSAGAGGTNYAAYLAQDDDIRRASFSMSDAENYARNNVLNFSDTSGESGDMPYEITNADIQRAIESEYIIKTAFTGNGGDGGSFKYKYTSPADSRCTSSPNGSVGRRPSVYDNASDYQFDEGGHRNVERQFIKFCNENTNPASPLALQNPFKQDKIGLGGDGGRGIYLQLQYSMPFYSTGVEGNWYIGSGENFPYVRYIGELYGNVGNRGYGIYKCSRTSNLDSRVCSSLPDGIIPDASDGRSVNNQDNSITLVSQDSVHYEHTANDGSAIGDKYIAFHVPSYSNLSYSGSFETIQTASATGGKGGTAGYTKDNQHYTEGTDDNSNFGWETYAKQKGDNGSDAAAGRGIFDTRYSITETSSTNTQEPKIKMEANLWKKSYSVGRPGTTGNHLHIQTSTMGTSCKINVPQAGPTFDYVTMVETAKNSGLTTDSQINDFLNKKKTEFEKKLNVEITCYDKDNSKIFNKTVAGGRYNVNLTGWTQPFYWNKSVNPTTDPKVVNVGGNIDPGFNGITSRWAKIFHTMDPLTNYRTSFAGSGTTITDRCLVEKGTYEFKTYRLYAAYGGSWYERQLNGRNQSYNQTWDGKINNYDCYKANADGVRLLNNLASEDSPYYTVTPPSSAGGGAVVISW